MYSCVYTFLCCCWCLCVVVAGSPTLSSSSQILLTQHPTPSPLLRTPPWCVPSACPPSWCPWGRGWSTGRSLASACAWTGSQATSEAKWQLVSQTVRCLRKFTHSPVTLLCLFVCSGSICVWDLKASLFRSSSFPASALVTFHPMVHLSAHKCPCRCISWCPHDNNYLFTGSGS